MPGFKWTKESAFAELDILIAQISPLMKVRRRSADHVEWIARTRAFLEEVFGRNSRYYQTFVKFKWERRGTVLVHLLDAREEMEQEDQAAYREDLDAAKGLLRVPPSNSSVEVSTAFMKGKAPRRSRARSSRSFRLQSSSSGR